MKSTNHQSLKIGFFMSCFAISILYLGLAYLFIFGTAIWSSLLDRWTVVFPTWLFLFVAFGVLIYYCLHFYFRPIGQILSIILTLGLGVLSYLYYLNQKIDWCIDCPAFNIFLSLGGLIFGVVSIFWTSFLLITRNRVQVSLNRKQHLGLLLILGLFGGLIAGSSTNWFNPYYTVIVPAQNKATPVEFSFWSHLNISTFTPTQLSELNQHHTILIAYEWYYSRNQTFLFAQQFRDQYPDIRIMFPIWGSYFYWENYEPMVDEYLTAITFYNLTNVIGFSFDIERENNTCAHDSSRLQPAITSLNECIVKIHSLHPDYRIYNTDGIWMMFGAFPFVGNEEIYRQHPLMSVTGWDYYSWQLYRGNAGNPEDDVDSTDIYERLLTSVQYLGANATRPIFGMMGVGVYGPDNCSVNSVPCNFAGIIKDCKLARALSIPEVQFYTLCSAGNVNGVYYPSMFEAYGQDFLDVLNVSVNALALDEEITIPGNNAFKGTAGYYWENMNYSIEGWAVVLIILLGLITSLVYYRKIISLAKNLHI